MKSTLGKGGFLMEDDHIISLYRARDESAIAHITHTYGGAYSMYRYAMRKKEIYNIAPEKDRTPTGNRCGFSMEKNHNY